MGTMYKIGDLVWMPKKKICGVILSWEVSDDDLMIFQIQYEKNNKTFMKYFPEYEIEYKRCEK